AANLGAARRLATTPGERRRAASTRLAANPLLVLRPHSALLESSLVARAPTAGRQTWASGQPWTSGSAHGVRHQPPGRRRPGRRPPQARRGSPPAPPGPVECGRPAGTAPAAYGPVGSNGLIRAAAVPAGERSAIAQSPAPHRPTRREQCPLRFPVVGPPVPAGHAARDVDPRPAAPCAKRSRRDSSPALLRRLPAGPAGTLTARHQRGLLTSLGSQAVQVTKRFSSWWAAGQPAGPDQRHHLARLGLVPGRHPHVPHRYRHRVMVVVGAVEPVQ